MTKSYKIYFAAPLFSDAEQEWNLKLANKIESLGHKVFLPQRDTDQNATEFEIFKQDKEGVEWADIVIGIMDGADPDSGTCWEMGYAYGLGKVTLALRTDFRRMGDSKKGFNLMISESATYVFNNIEDLMHLIATNRTLDWI